MIIVVIPCERYSLRGCVLRGVQLLDCAGSALTDDKTSSAAAVTAGYTGTRKLSGDYSQVKRAGFFSL